jgi:hypothetical protein
MMKDAGTRLGETLQVRVGDVHFEENPVRVSIRKETTKATRHGRMGREVFVTHESVEFFGQLMEQRKLGPEDPLFYRGSPINAGDEFRMTLYRWLPKLGLDKKIPGHKYHQVHAHTLRKFFFSATVQSMGETAAHALMGHQFYLKTYFKKPLEGIRADYLRAASNLLVMWPSDDVEARRRVTFDLLRGLGFNDEGIASIGKKMQETGTSEITPELLGEVKGRLLVAWGLTEVRQINRTTPGIW